MPKCHPLKAELNVIAFIIPFVDAIASPAKFERFVLKRLENLRAEIFFLNTAVELIDVVDVLRGECDARCKTTALVYQDVRLLADVGLIELKESGPRKASKPEAKYSEIVLAA